MFGRLLSSMVVGCATAVLLAGCWMPAPYADSYLSKPGFAELENGEDGTGAATPSRFRFGAVYPWEQGPAERGWQLGARYSLDGADVRSRDDRSLTPRPRLRFEATPVFGTVVGSGGHIRHEYTTYFGGDVGLRDPSGFGAALTFRTHRTWLNGTPATLGPSDIICQMNPTNPACVGMPGGNVWFNHLGLRATYRSPRRTGRLGWYASIGPEVVWTDEFRDNDVGPGVGADLGVFLPVARSVDLRLGGVVHGARTDISGSDRWSWFRGVAFSAKVRF